MQDSGQPEDAGTAKLEDAGTEATRETIIQRQGSENSGQLGNSNPRQSRKVRRAGQPANPPGGATVRAMPRGNPKHQRQRHRRTRDAGQPEDPSPAQPEDAEAGVTRGMHRQAQSEEQSCGATQSLSAGCAEGCEIRGDPKIHRRQGRKMQKPGQPGGCIDRRRRRSDVWGNLNIATECAEGRERRGNSKLGRRQSLKMQDAGQLATSSGGATGSAEPRGSSSRTCRRMRVSGQLETRSRAQP